jgi:hypothetical protein
MNLNAILSRPLHSPLMDKIAVSFGYMHYEVG